MAALEMTSQIPDLRRRFAQQMADYEERVAENVVKARLAAGYDREPFALRAGISPKQLARIEDGTSIPRLATIRKIAETAGVPITRIRPDLEAEENELRAQLDRIEKKVDEVLRRLSEPVELDEHTEQGLPAPEPIPPARKPNAPKKPSQRKKQAKRRRSA